MAKSQKRSNREERKPKATKTKTAPTALAQCQTNGQLRVSRDDLSCGCGRAAATSEVLGFVDEATQGISGSKQLSR